MGECCSKTKRRKYRTGRQFWFLLTRFYFFQLTDFMEFLTWNNYCFIGPCFRISHEITTIYSSKDYKRLAKLRSQGSAHTYNRPKIGKFAKLAGESVI